MSKIHKVNVYDENGKVIARVAYNRDLDFWNGKSWNSNLKGGHKGLARLKTGEYILIYGSDYDNFKDYGEVVSDEAALKEILKSNNIDLLKTKKCKHLRQLYLEGQSKQKLTLEDCFEISKAYRVDVYDKNNKIITQVIYNSELDKWDGSAQNCGIFGKHKGLTRLKTGEYVLIYGDDYKDSDTYGKIVSDDIALKEILESKNLELLEYKKYKELKKLYEQKL